jgi:hypothetical protein
MRDAPIITVVWVNGEQRKASATTERKRLPRHQYSANAACAMKFVYSHVLRLVTRIERLFPVRLIYDEIFLINREMPK